jgi:hypothetical protein
LQEARDLAEVLGELQELVQENALLQVAPRTLPRTYYLRERERERERDRESTILKNVETKGRGERVSENKRNQRP